MKWIHCFLLIPMLGICAGSVPEEQAVFDAANAENWREVFFDDCTGDWQELWFLDGEIGSVENSSDGMQLTAGPQFKNDAHHMVLWTKRSFEGDLKIEFDYTRLDQETRLMHCRMMKTTRCTFVDGATCRKRVRAWLELILSLTTIRKACLNPAFRIT